MFPFSHQRFSQRSSLNSITSSSSSSFSTFSRSNWKDPENQKQFFLSVAKHFDDRPVSTLIFNQNGFQSSESEEKALLVRSLTQVSKKKILSKSISLINNKTKKENEGPDFFSFSAYSSRRDLLMKHFEGSIFVAVSKLFPEESKGLFPWNFFDVRSSLLTQGKSNSQLQRSTQLSFDESFWQDPLNQRRFLEFCVFGRTLSEEVKNKEHIEKLWYESASSSKARIRDPILFDSLLKNRFEGSFFEAIRNAYPEIDWKPFLFKNLRLPRGYWDNLENRRLYFDYLGEQLGISKNETKEKKEEAWYGIRRSQIVEINQSGSGARNPLATYYAHSVQAALKEVYPEIEWKPWLFDSGVSLGFWKKRESRRAFFDWTLRELEKQDEEVKNFSKRASSIEARWYSVSSSSLPASKRIAALKGGEYIMTVKFKNSLMRALQDSYPEIAWKAWMFDGNRIAIRGFWRKKENRVAFLLWFEKDVLHFGDDRSQWYSIAKKDIDSSERMKSLLDFNNNNNNNNKKQEEKEEEEGFIVVKLWKVLRDAFPDFDWRIWQFSNLGDVPPNFWKRNKQETKNFLQFVLSQEEKIGGNNGKEDPRDLVKKYSGLRNLLRVYDGNSLSIDQAWRLAKIDLFST